MVTWAPASLVLRPAPIGDLPLYDPDRDGAAAPAAWLALRQTVALADAVLFVTPEYNRSIPGALKNAVDIASRPYDRSAWAGKPAAIVSLSPGALGGFGAHHQLRQCLACLDMPLLPAEAYVSRWNSEGSPDARAFLERFMAAFATWAERHAVAAPIRNAA